MMNSRFNSKQDVLLYFFLSHILIKTRTWLSLLQRWDALDGVGRWRVRRKCLSFSGFINISSRSMRFCSSFLKLCTRTSFTKPIV